mmetsp:Transcript_5768/g.8489  ORF Transcript_5768/g.8489 Transcript_5768/m.8489 type:complete len:184 (+) Transcript_5768:28-579(+)
MDDQPIYGDENSKTKKIILLIISIAVGTIVLVTSILLIVYGIIQHWQHFVFLALILSLFIPQGILLVLQWRLPHSMDPRLKIINVVLFILIIAACAASLTYVFGITYQGKACLDSGTDKTPTLYRKDTDFCYSITTTTATAIFKPNTCVRFGIAKNPAEEPDQQYADVITSAFYNQTTQQCLW